MNELKTQVEEFFLIENEIYKFLKIDEHYLVLYHTQQHSDYASIDPTLFAAVELFQEFKKNKLFPQNFENDKLTVLKLKTINRLASQLLSMEVPSNNNQFLNMEGKKMAYFDKWLQNCENKLKMIEAQRQSLESYLSKC